MAFDPMEMIFKRLGVKPEDLANMIKTLGTFMALYDRQVKAQEEQAAALRDVSETLKKIEGRMAVREVLG